MRHDALKRRRVEVLDVHYNDKVQREADMKPSIMMASSAEGGEMDDVDSGKLCYVLCNDRRGFDSGFSFEFQSKTRRS